MPRPGTEDVSEVKDSDECLFVREGDKMPTFPDVQVDERGAEFVAVLGVGVDFGGETGGGAVLRNVLAGTHLLVPQVAKVESYRFRHLLHNPVHNSITELLIAQLQSKEICQRQPDPLAVLVRFVIAIVGVVLIAMGIMSEELPGVQKVAVDLEGLVRGVHRVEVDRQA